jgi:hypothetical protein
MNFIKFLIGKARTAALVGGMTLGSWLGSENVQGASSDTFVETGIHVVDIYRGDEKSENKFRIYERGDGKDREIMYEKIWNIPEKNTEYRISNSFEKELGEKDCFTTIVIKGSEVKKIVYKSMPLEVASSNFQSQRKSYNKLEGLVKDSRYLSVNDRLEEKNADLFLGTITSAAFGFFGTAGLMNLFYRKKKEEDEEKNEIIPGTYIVGSQEKESELEKLNEDKEYVIKRNVDRNLYFNPRNYKNYGDIDEKISPYLNEYYAREEMDLAEKSPVTVYMDRHNNLRYRNALTGRFIKREKAFEMLKDGYDKIRNVA